MDVEHICCFYSFTGTNKQTTTSFFDLLLIDSHPDFRPQDWSWQSVAIKVWDPPPFLSSWQDHPTLTANVQTSVPSPCSDVGLQCGTTHFIDDKDSWLSFSPLCVSNVTIRTQAWQPTRPRTYAALSVLKKAEASRISVASLPPLLHLGSVKVAHSSDVYSECWR